MADQAETLRSMMRFFMAKRAVKNEHAITVFLAPEVRRKRLFSPRELSLLNRKRHGIYRIRDESEPLADSGGSPEILGRLTVLSGDEIDLLASYQRVKNECRDRGVKKMDILICGVESESEGRRIFVQLFETCRRFLDIDLIYVGALSRGEKIRESIAISKFLLHYQSRTRECPNGAGSPDGR